MKRSVFLSAVIALGATLSVVAQDDVKFAVPGSGTAPAATAAGAAPAAPVAPKYTEAQLLETFGWFIGRRVGLAELSFSEPEIATLIKGLKTAATGGEAPYDLQLIGPAMDTFMQQKQATYMETLRQKGAVESAAFLAQIQAKPGVIALPSGLLYEVMEVGTGAKPAATDIVSVNYVGRLADGTVFDSSEEQGPADFSLEGVIPGMSEGLQQLNVGSKARLYIPSDLAYGDQGQGGIPPAAALVFDVEVLSAKPAPAPEAAAPAKP